jgi:hypothetical protein
MVYLDNDIDRQVVTAAASLFPITFASAATLTDLPFSLHAIAQDPRPLVSLEQLAGMSLSRYVMISTIVFLHRRSSVSIAKWISVIV